MILDELDAKERIESPLNLLNRLRRDLSKKTNIVGIPPTASEVIENLEDKLKYGGLKSKAASIMSDALDELKLCVRSTAKPRELAAIAESMNKVVTAQTDKGELEKPQIIVYAPSFVNESSFETVYVRD